MSIKSIKCVEYIGVYQNLVTFKQLNIRINFRTENSLYEFTDWETLKEAKVLNYFIDEFFNRSITISVNPLNFDDNHDNYGNYEEFADFFKNCDNITYLMASHNTFKNVLLNRLNEFLIKQDKDFILTYKEKIKQQN